MNVSITPGVPHFVCYGTGKCGTPNGKANEVPGLAQNEVTAASN
jgi:hypothetical protein